MTSTMKGTISSTREACLKNSTVKK